jgi:CarD family transcriptional regulator
MAAKPKKSPAKAVQNFAFEKGDFVVYPTHGVGKVIDIEAKEIAGHKLDLFVISFEQERMMLRVPVMKAKLSGLRKLSSRKIMENAQLGRSGVDRRSRARPASQRRPARPVLQRAPDL